MLVSVLTVQAKAGVVMSNSGATAPSAGDSGISQTSVGGTLSGSLDYSNNGGALGQSFTLAAGNFQLKALSLNASANFGPNAFTTGTWNVQITRYDNAASGPFGERVDSPLVPLSDQYTGNMFSKRIFTAIATIGTNPVGGDWITFTFTGGDIVTLEGGHTYAFQVTSSNDSGRWAGFNVASSDVYAGGERFNAYGSATFNDNWVNGQNAADRAFVLNLSAVADADGDGITDSWEIGYFGNLSHNGTADGDADDLTDLQEFTEDTNPVLADTDGDGLKDGAEVTGSGNLFALGTPTDPHATDSDGDRVSDYAEVHGTLNSSFNQAATDPNVADTDGDFANDYKELVYHSNPNDWDSLPTPRQFYLIDNTHQNGSFETKNGGVPITTKIGQWDAPGNDIDNWTEWGALVAGPSTAGGDSGVEAGGSEGPNLRAGYFQSGNAAYNLTANVATAGSVYAATWKQLNRGGDTISVRLVYKNAANNIVAIPDSIAITNTTGGIGDLIYQIPVGSPAIGHQIGIGVASQGYWIDTDEFALSIAATGDDDGDGLSNLWETANGLNPNSAVGVNGASGDPDSDGFTNAQEQDGGSNPQLTASVPGDIDGDALNDFWELAYFGGLFNPNGAASLDPDGDYDTNLVEFLNTTDPLSKIDFYSSTGDSVSDSWKTHFGIALTTTGEDDSDSDGLTNDKEFILTTSPVVKDSDGDGLSDGDEVNIHLTDPLDTDSDNDSLSDGAEVRTYLTDPKDTDTDDDGYPDGIEVNAGSNPVLASSTPLSITGATVLIDTLRRNGSFEMVGGIGSVAKIQHWDNDPDGDVDNWTLWDAAASGPATASNDSGTETRGEATAGSRVGYLQPGNAAYNRSGHLIAVGEAFSYTWDWLLAGRGDVTAQLAYWDPTANGGTGGAITIPGTATTNPSTVTQHLALGTTWTATTGDPAIGKEIVMTIQTTGNFPEVDNVVLSVMPAVFGADSDFDGMADAWETTYFGGLGQTATGDFDNDGSNNLDEFRLNLIPNKGSSRFTAILASGGIIQWPSVTGVNFRIERSTSLDAGSWVVLEAALPGAAGTTSYTDPSPPIGKAFYKIGLNP